MALGSNYKPYFQPLGDGLLWRLLIADGDQSVHQKIKETLSKQVYNDRVQIVPVKSRPAAEAIEAGTNENEYDNDLPILYDKSMTSFFNSVNFHSNLNDCLKEALLIVDRSNTVLYYNQCFHDTFGRLAGIRKGMALDRFLKKLDWHILKNEENEYAVNLLRDPGTDSGEGELRIKSGGDKIFSLSVRTITDMTGAQAGRIMIFYDTTDPNIQIEQLQNECRVLAKLNEKNEIIINSISAQTKVRAEENDRSASRFAEKMLAITADYLQLLADTIVCNSNLRKQVSEITEIIEQEKNDIGEFISNIEEKHMELKKACKNLASHMQAHKVQKMQETGLDKKEILILQMIASLKSNKEIAGELNYEEETIKNKITVIRRKLKLADRCHLVSFAYRNGLI